MSIFKSKIGLKLTVFATILLVLFWMIPSGMVFGEGEEVGNQDGGTVVETIPPETIPPETIPPETIPPETIPPETIPPETTAPDTTVPVITLLGDAQVNIFVGDEYTDAGATASDDVDGDITADIEAGGSVDTSSIGSYILTYNVSDAANNAADTVTRTVIVSELPDNTAPIITLNGDAVIELHIGATFIDPGAAAIDDKDENVEVTTTGTVNSNVAGAYIISYNALDAAGNAATTVTRTVNVTSSATIFTDKPDYLPNDYVLVTGSGWLPGETVKLDFHETLLDPIFQQITTYYTVADSEGNIWDIQYLIELRHLGASFILTATGQTSGLVAQTTFTDARQATPTFNPAGPGVPTGTLVTITSSNAEHIYYTTDGSAPTTSSTEYTGPVTINPPKTLKAIATKAGFTTSYEKSVSYTLAKQATPTFNPAGPGVPTGQLVTITSSGAEHIYYTTDGSTPTTSSTEYTVPVTINPPMTLKAIATCVNYANSDPKSVSYTLAKQATPTFNPAGPAVPTGQLVTITSSGAEHIYYTTDGSTPTTSSTEYTVPVTINPPMTLKAIATCVNYSNSDAQSVNYTLSNQITIHKFGDTIVPNGTLDSGEPSLVGVQFELFKSTGQWWNPWESKGVLSTDSSGNLTFPYCIPGSKYRVTEKAAASGYSLISTPVFEDTINTDQTINVPNTPTRSISIHKFGDIVIQNGTQDIGEPDLSGVQFELFLNTTFGLIWDSQVVLSTDASGNVTFSGLNQGSTYRVTEKAAASGYSLISTPVYENTITGNENILVPNVAPANITIHKFGDTNQNDTQDIGEPSLSGVQFELSIERDIFGVKYWEVVSVPVSTTDSNGDLKFANLNQGNKYKIIEKAAAPGYSLIANSIYEKVLTASETIIVPNVTPPYIKIHKFGDTLVLNGTQDTGEPSLSGVQFELFIERDIVGVKYWESQGVLPTDSNGDLTFLNLVVGNKYRVTEKAAAPGYSLIATPVYEKVITKDETIQVPNIDGRITLRKADNNTPSNPLGGAVFALYSADNEASLITGSEVSSDPVTGGVLFEHLNFGTYYVHEKTAPTGFVPDEGFYRVEITTDNPHYTFTSPRDPDPIVNSPGGTITVTKNVIAPDGKTNVDDDTEFTITLQKKDGSGWVDVKSVKIKEGPPVVFSVPLNITYRVVETADSKYSEMNKPGEVTLRTQGQDIPLTITNRQHYAIVTVVKLIHEGPLVSFNFITDDDHIFWLKMEGGYKPFIEQHPITAGIPTVFLVWPGTYTMYEKPDANYNEGGQPRILYGLDILSIDWGNLSLQEILNILATFGKQDIELKGGDIQFIGVFNEYTPTKGTVTATKDVVGPDAHSQVPDTTPFPVKLQRLNLDLPSVLDLLDLGAIFDGLDLTNIADILGSADLSKLTDLSLDWVDVGSPKTIADGQTVVWEGVEVDHIYRVVETHVPGYEQIKGILPFYFAPDETNLTAPVNKQIDIVNLQKLVFVKISKNVIGPDGSDVADDKFFWVKLEGGRTQTWPQLIREGQDALFAVLPGTYTLTECPENCYNRIDQNQSITLLPDTGPLCDPVDFTVTNQQKPGTINITKNGLMRGDSAIFTLCDKDGNPIAGKAPITLSEGQSGSWTGLNWGRYTISESYPSANLYTYGTEEYCPSGPISIGCMGCMDCLSKRVVIKNKDPRIKEAEIVVIKYVYGTLLAGENFSFTNSQGPGFTLDGTESPTAWQETIVVQAGKTYTIAENDPGADWMTTWDSTLPNTITTFGIARDVTFTVTGDNIASIDGKNISFYNNRKTCEVIIDKTIGGAPAAEGTFNFSGPTSGVSSRTLSASNFSLPDSGIYQKSFTLECGIEYTVSEDSMSAGYVFNNIAASPAVEVTGQTGSSITFKLHCNNIAQNRVTNIPGGNVGVINTITFDNSRVPGTINLHKTDAISGDNLAGAVFRLFLPDGTTQAMDFEGDDLVPDVTTDAAGLGSFANLAWGSYIVREIIPPVGYEPIEADVTIDGSNLIINLEAEIANPRIPGKLRLQKVDSTNALLAVANATYEVRDSGGNLVALITTAADGWAVVSLPWGTYSVKEVTSPAGYDLDPTTYSVTIGASSLEPWLYLKDNPSKGGGGGKLTVAGITEGIQVLAFTGIDPIIPISGGSAIIAGLAMLVVTLRRRNSNLVKSESQKIDG